MTIRTDDEGLSAARARKRALEQKYAKGAGGAGRPPRGNPDGGVVVLRRSKASMEGGASSHGLDFNKSYDLSSDWDNDHHNNGISNGDTRNNRSLNGSGNRSFNGSGHGSSMDLGSHLGKNRQKKKGAKSIDSGMSGSNGSLNGPPQKTKVRLRDTDRLLRRSNHGAPGMERAPSRGRALERQGSSRVRSRSTDGASVASAKSTRTSATAASTGGMSLARQNSIRSLSVERTGSKRSVSAEPTNRRGLSKDPSVRGRSTRSVSQEPGSRARSSSKERLPPRPGVGEKQKSTRPGVGAKQASARPAMADRQRSTRPGMGRVMSSRPGMGSKQMSARPGAGMSRDKSIRPGKAAMERELSERALKEKMQQQQSKRGGFFGKKPRSARILTGSGTRFEYSSGKRRFIPHIEKAPPKSLVLIWVVVTIELMMDLVTTIISFVALTQEDDCCGEPIQLGMIPVGATLPFFLLIIAEVAFLARAMKLTMCPTPPELERRYMEEDDRWCITRWICCCIRWNARMLFRAINWLVLLNPFFGAVVAWMLLYQSSKLECFIVLGLEGASLILHFLSIYLEGERQTRLSMTIHLLPILPFLASVILILVYLQQGGVCYLVKESKFWYDGCRVCENGLPPVDNKCLLNETVWNNYTDPATGEYITIAAYDIKEIELSLNPLFATQDTYCGDGSSPEKFCFFTY